MSADLLKAIKQISVDAVQAGKPTDIRYGVVTSAEPLRVRVSATFILPETVIIVPEHIKYVQGVTDPITGITPIVLSEGSGLSEGDKVILIREQGGGKYIVIGRY